MTAEYKAKLALVACQRPRSLDQPYSLWTCQRLVGYMAEETGIRASDETVRHYLSAADIVLSRPQHKGHESGPRVRSQKRTVEDIRDHLKLGAVFYYADEFNLSWLATLKAVDGMDWFKRPQAQPSFPREVRMGTQHREGRQGQARLRF